MIQRKRLRDQYMSYDRWYYHMVLDSLGTRKLFNNREEYVYGMNAVALAQYMYDVRIIQFDLMSNHAHFVVLATGMSCLNFFYLIRAKINSRLVSDGYAPIPADWFFRLFRLETKEDLVNAVSYSARNPYDAINGHLPSGYLWSSSYMMFSDLTALIESRTVGETGIREMRRILGSKTRLPDGYKVCKLGYVLPESYVMRVGGVPKAMTLYGDAKDYSYSIFKDYGTYRKTASDFGEEWAPSGSDAKRLVSDLLNLCFGVKEAGKLDTGRKCDLAVMLGTRYGMPPAEIAGCTGLSPSAVSRLLYSYSKHK